MVPFENVSTMSYCHSIATVAVYLAVPEILSVKLWRDLEIWAGSHSRSFKMAPFNRS